MFLLQTLDDSSQQENEKEDEALQEEDSLGADIVSLELPPSPTQNVNWVELVERIKLNEASALEELYALFARGIKFMIIRQLGRQDLEDRVHDIFVIVVQALQRGDLREPERLMGFVRTIVRRQIANSIEKNYSRRRDELEVEGNVKLADAALSPEQSAIRSQNARIMADLLNECSRRDREILTRFYLLEHTQEQICADMGLTETQFRLLKSRAKQRFSDEGKRRMAHGKLRAIFVRSSSGF